MREKNIHRFRITNHFKLFNQNSYRQEYRNIYYAKYCGRGGGGRSLGEKKKNEELGGKIKSGKKKVGKLRKKRR